MRVFTVIAGVTFKLQNLTVANGAASGSNGGGVYNSGAMDVTNVTFSGNSATSEAGSLYNYSGATMNVKKHHRCQHPRERKLHWHDHQWRR